MENQKNNKAVIALLIIIIIILAGLCVLFATGTISFKNNEIDNNKNNEIDKNDLNVVYDILGLSENYGNECLNNYISQNNFRNNSKEIFAWYVLSHKMDTKTGQAEIIRDVDGDGNADIEACDGAADCGSIKINDANKIIKLYGLIGIDEYLEEMPEPYKNDEYLINYFQLSGRHPMNCNIETSHNLDAKYDEFKNIIIVDEQNIIEYDYNEGFENATHINQVVTYTFKKDNNSNYYLNDVNVK